MWCNSMCTCFLPNGLRCDPLLVLCSNALGVTCPEIQPKLMSVPACVLSNQGSLPPGEQSAKCITQEGALNSCIFCTYTTKRTPPWPYDDKYQHISVGCSQDVQVHFVDNTWSPHTLNKGRQQYSGTSNADSQTGSRRLTLTASACL